MIQHSLSLEAKGKASAETDVKLVCCKLKNVFVQTDDLSAQVFGIRSRLGLVEQSAVASW